MMSGHEEATVVEMREVDWGEGILSRNAQMLTDGMISRLGEQLGLDELGSEILQSTVREHTVRVAQASQRCLLESMGSGFTAAEQGKDAEIIEFPGA